MKSKLCLLILSFVISASALSQPGSPDITFGTNGKVITPIGKGTYDVAHAMAVQSDGKIIVAGETTYNRFALTRYTVKGDLDKSFGGGGKVTTAIGYYNDIANAIAIQPDGKIVVAGVSYNGVDWDFAVARYTTAGVLDNTFDGDGKLTLDIGGSNNNAYAIAIQSDGKIIVVGESLNGSDLDFALARYTASGALDIAFDGDGIVTTDFNSLDDAAYSIAIQADGKIIAAGSAGFSPWQTTFALVRYTSSGALDNSFDNDGKITTAIGSHDDRIYALAIQADGKIVAAGYLSDGYGALFALARYTVTGELDISFDGDGIIKTIIGAGEDFAYAVAIQADGKIVAGGYSMSAGNFRNFSLARYTCTGVLDNTFGTGGKVIFPLGGDESGYGMVLFGNRIYVAGFIISALEGSDFAVAAFNNDGLPLPLSLSLTATKSGSSVLLNWQTTSEQNTALFNTERSSDGNLFTSMGSVTAAGNTSSVLNYFFIDTIPVAGVNFYRLKTIDTDGNFTYSKTVIVNYKEDPRLLIFPNPVTDELQIQATGNEIANIQFTDATGRIMKQQKAEQKKNTSFSVDVRSLPKGTYYLVLQIGEKTEIAEFIN